MKEKCGKLFEIELETFPLGLTAYAHLQSLWQLHK